MSTTWLWLKGRWKIALGSILGLLGIFSVYLRLRTQKKVLQKANESHKKDLEINSNALETLTTGMEAINKSTADNLEKARIDHEDNIKDILHEKQEFIEQSKDDDNLARELAKQLGAKFVEKK